MSVTDGHIRGKYHQDKNVPWSNPAISQIHENIERHTVDTIVSWPNPKQWVKVHTYYSLVSINLHLYMHAYNHSLFTFTAFHKTALYFGNCLGCSVVESDRWIPHLRCCENPAKVFTGFSRHLSAGFTDLNPAPRGLSLNLYHIANLRILIWIGNAYVAVAEKNLNICIYSQIYTGIYNINLIETLKQCVVYRLRQNYSLRNSR